MSETTLNFFDRINKIKLKNNYLLHIALFAITFVTTLIAGIEWTTGKAGPYEFYNLTQGLPYAISILFILGVHEFGHYFAAKFHKVIATLPYFIPFPPIMGFFNFGTMGAVIKTKSQIPNNRAMFDIGSAGPIAGFIACLIILIYGFTHLPTVDYILAIHPDYFSPDYGKGAIGLEFGDTLLFVILRKIFIHPNQFVPPMSEIYHYPYLCVGWFGLFVTSMNLIPVGQLDGGHVIYSMFGEKKHEAIASVSMILLLGLGIIGILSNSFKIGFELGWSGWLFWALILYFFIKIKHPPVMNFEKLSKSRITIGIIAMIIFFLSFSPTPFVIAF
jgi:membrane-associated protease RseP (regulator of RpoE activity)